MCVSVTAQALAMWWRPCRLGLELALQAEKGLLMHTIHFMLPIHRDTSCNAYTLH